MSLEIGQIIGDYEITGVLGAGGMGRVYKARNLISDRVDALKILLSDLRSSGDLAERFVHEIKVLAKLSHPHIAALHTAMRVSNQLLMVMEFVDGSNLEELLETGKVTATEGLHYTVQVLSALEYAHSRGVVHRDIKPANIAINRSGTVKLLDFGLARSHGDKRLTRTGVIMGSLFYMAPEQVMGRQADARSDIYSTGIALYRILTGRRPIDGDSEFAVMRAQVNDRPLPLYHWNPTIPIALSDVVMRAIEKAPGERFQTAWDFRSALEPYFQWSGQLPAPVAGGSKFEPAALESLQRLLARWMGPIAGALVKRHARQAQSLSGLYEALAGQIPSEPDRSVFLDQCRTEFGAGREAATGLTVTLEARPSPPAPTWDPAMLERFRKLLAPHVGPMARIIVDRASKKTARVEDLCAMLSKEIESEPERERFLKACETGSAH